MIKCPNCGSTAQVECCWEEPSLSTNETYKRGFSCGCGCNFIVTFEISSIKILEED